MIVGIGVGIPFSGSGAGVGPWTPPPPNPNLLLWSEQFQQAAWTKTAVTVTPDAVNDPNEELTADLLDSSSESGQVDQTSPSAAVPGAPYTASVYVKAGPGHAGGSAFLQISDGVGTGSVGLEPNGTWQRMVVTRTLDPLASLLSVVLAVNLDGASSIYAWGAKLEEGAVATAYVKREGV